jgi:hypothetical protein
LGGGGARLVVKGGVVEVLSTLRGRDMVIGGEAGVSHFLAKAALMRVTQQARYRAVNF